MTAEASEQRERRNAWLMAASGATGLLSAAVLFLVLGDARWAVLALVLSNGLAFGLSLLHANSLRARRAAQIPTPLRRDPNANLPVHPVTGLHLWWILRQRLMEEIARSARHQHHFAFVMLEPANLLEPPSEQAYRSAATLLRKAIRKSDLAGHYDDERFVAMLPETDAEGAIAAGRRFIASLCSRDGAGNLWRGAFVIYPEDGDDPDRLLAQALIALRRRRSGRSTSSPPPEERKSA